MSLSLSALFVIVVSSLCCVMRHYRFLPSLSLFVIVYMSPSLLQHVGEVYTGAFVFSVTGYLGISFVLQLVRLYGALVSVTGKHPHNSAGNTMSGNHASRSDVGGRN